MNDSNQPALVLRLGAELVDRQLFPDRIGRNVYRIPHQLLQAGLRQTR